MKIAFVKLRRLGLTALTCALWLLAVSQRSKKKEEGGDFQTEHLPLLLSDEGKHKKTKMTKKFKFNSFLSTYFIAGGYGTRNNSKI